MDRRIAIVALVLGLLLILVSFLFLFLEECHKMNATTIIAGIFVFGLVT